MRRYETIFIADPDIPDETRDPIYERLGDIIRQHNGFLARTEKWGTKRLSYPVKKKVRGYYVRLDYCGDGTLVNEIERFFRIEDRILKFMTVLLEKNADLDRIKEEIAQIEAAEAETNQRNQAAAEQSVAPNDSSGDDIENPTSDASTDGSDTGDTTGEPQSESDEPQSESADNVQLN
jgi:small subunit ribosomal protein S6